MGLRITEYGTGHCLWKLLVVLSLMASWEAQALVKESAPGIMMFCDEDEARRNQIPPYKPGDAGCTYPTAMAAAEAKAAIFNANSVVKIAYDSCEDRSPGLIRGLFNYSGLMGFDDVFRTPYVVGYVCHYYQYGFGNGAIVTSSAYVTYFDIAVSCPVPSDNPAAPYSSFDIYTSTCVRYVQNSPNLIISLTGGNEVEPWHKKHDPEHSKANLPYKAIVTQNGQPKTDFAVTITTDATSNSGGHAHTNGRPKGKLVDQVGTSVTTKDGKAEIKGKTNGSGVFEFTFGAEEASGTHTLTAKCDSGCKEPATATVNVKVEGLEPIPDVTYIKNPDASFYTLIDADGTVIGATTDKHKANHYLTPDASTILLYMASSYHAEINYWEKPVKGKRPTPPLPLHLNDASLVWGGVFDINGTWKNPHVEHRRGTVIDIRANSKTGAIPSRNFEKFIKLAKYYGAHAKIHSPGSDNQHFHVRLLNREE